MDAQAPELPSLGGSLAVTFLSLGLVCLLAYVTLKWVSRRGLGHARGPIRVVARCSPEPKRSFFLVETAGRCFLVGASDGGMTLLAEVDPQQIINEVRADEPVGARLGRSTRGRFSEILARVLARPAESERRQALSSPTDPDHKV